MMTPGKLDSVKTYEKPEGGPSASATPDAKRTDLPDFDSLLASSNAERRAELEKEKAASGGDFKIGENKTDTEFRETLEKISGKKQDKLKNKLEKDDYLNLMVTQLKYQDPTKPMDNQEMATQLAQFNTVEQLMAANKTLGEMKAQSGAASVEKLSPYLGKDVDVAGNTLVVRPDRGTTDASIKIPVASSAVSVLVKDASGTVVRTLGLGDLPAGTHRVPFDGKDDKGNNLPTGRYTFGVSASSIDGKAIEAATLMSVRVEGITDLATGGKLETAGGPIDVKDIVAIRAPRGFPVAEPRAGAAVPNGETSATSAANAVMAATPQPAPAPSAPPAAAAAPAKATTPQAVAAAPRRCSPGLVVILAHRTPGWQAWPVHSFIH